MGAPHTAKEAIYAELLGDMDALLARAEAIPAALADYQDSIALAVLRLDEAGVRHHAAIARAAADARESLMLLAKDISAKVSDAHTRDANATKRIDAATQALQTAASRLRQSVLRRLIDVTLSAALASVMTALLFTWPT